MILNYEITTVEAAAADCTLISILVKVTNELFLTTVFCTLLHVVKIFVRVHIRADLNVALQMPVVFSFSSEITFTTGNGGSTWGSSFPVF